MLSSIIMEKILKQQPTGLTSTEYRIPVYSEKKNPGTSTTRQQSNCRRNLGYSESQTLPYPVLEGNRAKLPEARISLVDRAQRFELHLQQGAEKKVTDLRLNTKRAPSRGRSARLCTTPPASRPPSALPLPGFLFFPSLLHLSGWLFSPAPRPTSLSPSAAPSRPQVH